MITLPIDWYIQPPIDFEYKQYILLAYLLKVDESFMNKKLSPFLLNMESVVNELYNFKNSYIDIRNKFDKTRYIYMEDNSKLVGENNKLIIEINEIVEFSIPMVKTRIELGNSILKKTKQVLYCKSDVLRYLLLDKNNKYEKILIKLI